ncbi:MAG: beta-ketoacyl-[acyl-carrier-protein] synthase family protein [Cytophagaceae bacterium]
MGGKVLITGAGIISGIGKNLEENYSALCNGKSGVGKISYVDTVFKDEIPVSEVKFSNEELAEMVGAQNEKFITRTSLLGMIAAREAMVNAGIEGRSGFRTGLISATSVGGMGKTEVYYDKLIAPGVVGDFLNYMDTHDCGQSTERIAEYLGVKDFMTTISTACSSSANAIMLGARMIRQGKLDRVIVGGTDSLTRFTINGFNTLMILDREHCKPFDDQRKGLNLGEGAGFIVIESEKAASEGNRPVFGEVKGYANTNDAYHQTASSPEGDGAYAAMSKALQVAGLKPSDIDYVNVHGTGTPNNDLSEGRAMEKLFGSDMPVFTSTKAYTGHTLGAAGGIEAVISMLTISRKIIFPNMNFRNQMQEISCTPATEIIRNVDVRNVVSNSFGFGGNNTALVFSKI